MKKKNIPLGDRMKSYEKEYDRIISDDENIVVRLDGHKFSKFTKGLIKPFDEVIYKAFEETCFDIMEEFNPSTIYYQSDEITVIFPSYKDKTVDDRKSSKHKLQKKIKEDWQHIYGGRTQKLVSLISGYCTMRFNYHFKKYAIEQIAMQDDTEYTRNLSKKMGNAWFDARAYGANDEETFNSVLWRYRDCIKNSKSMVAYAYCSHKSLLNMNGDERVQFCKETTGHDWNEVSPKFKYGTFFKRAEYIKNTEHGKVVRTKCIPYFMSPEEFGFSTENVDFILCKKLPLNALKYTKEK